jgi:small-conductance mechanosensitive channel
MCPRRSGLTPHHGTRTARYAVTIAATIGALAAMGVSSTLGNVHAHGLEQRLIAFIGTFAFFVFAVVAVRSLANELARIVDVRAGRDGGTAVRIIVSVIGFVLIAFVGLGLLSVSVQHLLIGGALTGVILGIAGQQALGNLFAGIVLLVSRPFTLDERVRIRAGSLGGVFDGTIRRIGLAYVSVETVDGLINIPNSVMLAVGVGPAPLGSSLPPPQPTPAPPTPAPPTPAPAQDPPTAPATDASAGDQ